MQLALLETLLFGGTVLCLYAQIVQLMLLESDVVLAPDVRIEQSFPILTDELVLRAAVAFAHFPAEGSTTH